MSEWWTYRIESFLLYSARTYYRLIETYNAEVWPLQLLALAAGALMLLALTRAPAPWRHRLPWALLAVAWWCVAWWWQHRRYAGINWAADYAAVLFAVQGAALLWWAARGDAGMRAERSPTAPLAWGLIAAGLVVYPLLPLCLGRPGTQAEVFALMPEPTAVVTLGMLLLAPRAPAWLHGVPLVSCAFSGALLWALRASDAAVAPALAALALLGLVIARRRLARRAR
jgi:Family of unknown function (DUF6064)